MKTIKILGSVCVISNIWRICQRTRGNIKEKSECVQIRDGTSLIFVRWRCVRFLMCEQLHSNNDIYCNMSTCLLLYLWCANTSSWVELRNIPGHCRWDSQSPAVRPPTRRSDRQLSWPSAGPSCKDTLMNRCVWPLSPNYFSNTHFTAFIVFHLGFI